MPPFRAEPAVGRRPSPRPTRIISLSLGALIVAIVCAWPPIAAAQPGPTLAITSPTPNHAVIGNVQLSAEVSDPDGVLRVNFYVDGLQVAADSAAPYAVTWDASSAPAGTHQLKVAAFDASPNRNKTVLSQTVTVAEPAVQPDAAGDAPVLWHSDSFCSRTTLHPGVGLCAGDGAWDVTACVPGTADEPQWSLQTPAFGVGRFEVRRGDQGADGGGDRCEIIQQTRAVTGMAPAPGRLATAGGEVRFFSFESKYDASVRGPSGAQYQTVAQWHQSTNATGCPTSSPLKIALSGASAAKRLEIQAQECYQGLSQPSRILLSEPLQTDTWQHWTFEIKWPPLPSVGYVRIWHNGGLVRVGDCRTDGRCMMSTRYSDNANHVAYNHFKLGNYRDKSIQAPTVVFHRNVVISAGD